MIINSIEQIVKNSPLFILGCARILATILTTPLLSIQSVPRIVKIALTGFIAFLIIPNVYEQSWVISVFSLEFLLLLVGEALIGVITGFFINIVFASFSSAGQFFSYQMGFGASEVYDALAQIENPLLGQFLNLIAMLVFIQIKGFQTFFLKGFLYSFQALDCFALANSQPVFISFFLKSLSLLFANAIRIAFPIMGTLFLIHVSMGLISRAAPQMNLMSEGFPITIFVSFLLLTLAMPMMINLFVAIIEEGFSTFQILITEASG